MGVGSEPGVWGVFSGALPLEATISTIARTGEPHIVAALEDLGRALPPCSGRH